ncbi:MAG TPA: rRNA maturation RNase YbeY [Candidatus Dormibacteraeota bacterium]|nr:rRNA maturation RNase YbeY [Candidatus Dormibacteraeota bacterium]
MRVTIRRAESVTGAAHGTIRRAALGPLLRRCGEALAVGPRVSLGLLLSDDEELRDLNRRFLGVDAPTDVLAFPGDDSDRAGDIAISVERAVAQDDGDGTAELRLLAVHGLLHCLGHDHAGAEAAASMTAATRALLPDQDVPDLETPPD